MNTVFHIARAFIFLVLASFVSTAFSSTVEVRAESGSLQSLEGVWAFNDCQYDPEPPGPPIPGEFDTQKYLIFQGNNAEGREVQYTSIDAAARPNLFR